ncbi:hypothetical protein L1887_38441 [Cichorium endivia]|nr:hypothetical protein L1887_38441 [Cichorium endivia]
MICRAVAKRDRNFFLNLIGNVATQSHLRQTHAQIILNGLNSDRATVTKLIQKFSDIGAISDATLICSTFPNPDLFLYNVIIKGLFLNNYYSNALSIYRQLLENTTLKPNNFTFASVIPAASKLQCSILGSSLHGHAIVGGAGSDLFVASVIVDMYLDLGKVGYAYKVFDGIPEPDTVLCNTIISGSNKNGCFDDSVSIFKDMILRGTLFDSTTFAAVLTAPAELQDLKLGMVIESLSIKLGFHSHVHVLTGLISLYAKCKDMSTARRLFDQIKHPDIIAYNAMISGFSFNHEIEYAINLFKQLLSSQHKIDSSTLVGLIPVHHPFGHSTLTTTIHSFCIKHNFISKISVSTALITVYTRLNEIDPARKLFDESQVL